MASSVHPPRCGLALVPGSRTRRKGEQRPLSKGFSAFCVCIACAGGFRAPCPGHSGAAGVFGPRSSCNCPFFLTKIARSPVQPRAAPRSPAQPRAAPRSPAQPRAVPRSPTQPRAAPRSPICKEPCCLAKREASGAHAHPRALPPAPAFSAHLSNLSPRLFYKYEPSYEGSSLLRARSLSSGGGALACGQKTRARVCLCCRNGSVRVCPPDGAARRPSVANCKHLRAPA